MSTARRAIAVFAVVMGSLLIGTWVVLFLAGAVDYGSSRVELVFLLVAEGVTGLTLIVGGVATATTRPLGVPFLLVGLGMLQYCSLFSIGVFAARGNLPATAWFVLLAAATGTAAFRLARDARVI